MLFGLPTQLKMGLTLNIDGSLDLRSSVDTNLCVFISEFKTGHFKAFDKWIERSTLIRKKRKRSTLHYSWLPSNLTVIGAWYLIRYVKGRIAVEGIAIQGD
ncbi:hypothetical protein KIN20_034659 [Parelaphostrongylus tenuis]|uniref:Uncharacterized protein n=1 Tax=Parelaphostrongylus tenuis TaxID=148309 RepID=A0AAD5WJC8_PARTN|nr:hypothetical protein KIN20_034659 [Parelaphostrongylus tenuis]